MISFRVSKRIEYTDIMRPQIFSKHIEEPIGAAICADLVLRVRPDIPEFSSEVQRAVQDYQNRLFIWTFCDFQGRRKFHFHKLWDRSLGIEEIIWQLGSHLRQFSGQSVGRLMKNLLACECKARPGESALRYPQRT